jgi:hypothetical protein
VEFAGERPLFATTDGSGWVGDLRVVAAWHGGRRWSDVCRCARRAVRPAIPSMTWAGSCGATRGAPPSRVAARRGPGARVLQTSDSGHTMGRQVAGTESDAGKEEGHAQVRDRWRGRCRAKQPGSPAPVRSTGGHRKGQRGRAGPGRRAREEGPWTHRLRRQLHRGGRGQRVRGGQSATTGGPPADHRPPAAVPRQRGFRRRTHAPGAVRPRG